jgi:hypothetical protein
VLHGAFYHEVWLFAFEQAKWERQGLEQYHVWLHANQQELLSILASRQDGGCLVFAHTHGEDRAFVRA